MIEAVVNVAKAESLASQAKSGKLTKDEAKKKMVSECGLTDVKADQLLEQHGVK